MSGTSIHARAGRVGAYAKLASVGALEGTRPMREAAETALNARLIEQHHIDMSAPDGEQRLTWARSSYFRSIRLKGTSK